MSGDAEDTHGERAHAHRHADELLTERLEAFLAARGEGETFTTADLVGAIDLPRFGHRDAHLLLVDLLGQGRVQRDYAGWFLVLDGPAR
jgi:hypothetical protein